MKRVSLAIAFALILFGTAHSQDAQRHKCDTLSIEGKCKLVTPQVCDLYDPWVIQTDCELSGFKLSLYNRWGEEVFKSEAFDKKGYPLGHGHKLDKKGREVEYTLAEGTYYWTIAVKLNGDADFRDVKTGYMTLMQITE